MEPYTPFPIVDLRAGLNLSAEPWMIPMQAFTLAENVYFYQGRVIKRKGYEKFATGTQVWDLDYDGGQNEPDVGDKVTSATETAGAYVKSYTVTSGAWTTNDAAGTIRFTKPGSETVAFADNEDLTNVTQSNTLAGGAGLGADGVALAADEQVYGVFLGVCESEDGQACADEREDCEYEPSDQEAAHLAFVLDRIGWGRGCHASRRQP